MNEQWIQYGLAGLITFEVLRFARELVKGVFGYLKARTEKKSDYREPSGGGGSSSLRDDIRTDRFMEDLSRNMILQTGILREQTGILRELKDMTTLIKDKVDDRIGI